MTWPNDKGKVVSGKIPWHRTFEVYENSIYANYDAQEKDWQYTNRLGLLKAFLTNKPIRRSKNKSSCSV